MTKTEKVLRFIEEAGKDGRRFGDIQRFIVEMNGRNYDEMDTLTPTARNYYMERNVPIPRPKRRYRGYWCTWLTGGSFYGSGVLNKFCTKSADGRWVYTYKGDLKPPFQHPPKFMW